MPNIRGANGARVTGEAVRDWDADEEKTRGGMTMTPEEYERRVRELEAEGLTRSDAQGVADAEAMQEDKR